MALQGSWVHRRARGVGKPLGELRRRVYRRSISKDIGVLEAIDELLIEVRDGEEKQWPEWLRAAIDAYRKHHPGHR
jgi:hypothetical protein